MSRLLGAVSHHPADEVVVGHDGKRYRAYTVGMCDLHLRNLAKRMRTAQGKERWSEFLGLVADMDQLLDRRSLLTRSHVA